MAGYVIHKSTRLPDVVSYSGPTWDKAGIRTSRRDVYTDKKEALKIAAALEEYNSVGFEVSEVSYTA